MHFVKRAKNNKNSSTFYKKCKFYSNYFIEICNLQSLILEYAKIKCNQSTQYKI